MTTLIGPRFTAVTYATATSTTPILGGGTGFSKGQRVTDGKTGKEYVFVQANSAVAAGDVVHIPSDTYVAAGLTTALSAASDAIGVAPFAFTSGDYGWVQVYGRCKVSVLGSAVKSVLLYSTTTAGALDDATASNYQVTGIALASTNPTASATVMSAFISWPKVLIRPGVL